MKEYIVQAYSQETIDSFEVHNAPELIRCKDCKHALDVGDVWIYCEKGLELDNSNMFRPDWYCADGERAENTRC